MYTMTVSVVGLADDLVSMQQGVRWGQKLHLGCVIHLECQGQPRRTLLTLKAENVINAMSEIYIVFVVQKQTRRVFALDCVPFLNSQKQNRGGAHNYTVAEKSPRSFSQKQMEREKSGKADLTHSSVGNIKPSTHGTSPLSDCLIHVECG